MGGLLRKSEHFAGEEPGIIRLPLAGLKFQAHIIQFFSTINDQEPIGAVTSVNVFR